MQKKVLLSSILVIALCLSVIAGSTYALFTDSATNNIAITSGDIEVAASLEIVSVWSAQGLLDQSADTSEYLVDENGHKYEHVAATDNKTFTNGGYAEIVDGKLVINKITPGDKVVAKITVENKGDIDMIYRYKITADDSKLAEGMVITANDESYESTKEYFSNWSDVVEVGAAAISHEIALELPVYAGNEYQSEKDDEKKVEYVITVEAVQGNALTDEAISQYDKFVNVTNRDELQLALNQIENGYTINILEDITGDVVVPQTPDVKYTINGKGHTFNGAIVVDGKSARLENSALVIKGLNFVAESKSALGEDAFINLGNGANASRYTNNVTIEGCTFTETNGGKTIAAVKSYTGGDKNLVITGSTVNAGLHSFVQVKNIEEGFVINNCTSYAKNGINVNNTYGLEVKNTTIVAEGYAFRCGEGSNSANAALVNEEFTFTDCALEVTAPAADDAVLVFRGNSINAKVTLVNTTVVGVESYNAAAAEIVKIVNP